VNVLRIPRWVNGSSSSMVCETDANGLSSIVGARKPPVKLNDPIDPAKEELDEPTTQQTNAARARPMGKWCRCRGRLWGAMVGWDLRTRTSDSALDQVIEAAELRLTSDDADEAGTASAARGAASE
jgi:hypothetical protein